MTAYLSKERVAYVEIRFEEGPALTPNRADCDPDGWFTTEGLQEHIRKTLQEHSEIDAARVTVFFLQDQADG